MKETKRISSVKTKTLHLKDHSNESLHLLLETIEGINRTVELRSLLAESMEAARLVMNSEASSLMLLDEDTGELYISLPTGPAKREIKGKSIPRHKGIGGWVIKHRKPYLTNIIEESPFFYGEVASDFTTRNIICVPLINRKNKIIGVLQALNKRKNQDFSPHDIPVFQALATHISIAIERTRQQEKLESRLKHKEVLLTEIHHRIKNNLATISALIEIELKDVHEEHARYVLKNTYSRIQSMTEVHDLLCMKGIFDEVELGQYLNKLAKKISATLSDPYREVGIRVRAEQIRISADKAMLCGLVLNELLVNIYKHAFDESGGGEITVELKHEKDGKIRLNVKDDGIGMPEDFDLTNTATIGTWVVNVLLRKLGSTVEIDSEEGTSFSIIFKK